MNDKPLYPCPWHPDDPAEWSPVSKSWRFTNKKPIPADVQKLLWSGRLSQLCPYCKHVEPAGDFCHNCRRQTGPDDYVKQQSVGEDGKPRRGRPGKGSVMRMVSNEHA
jgi:hypothetical protein